MKFFISLQRQAFIKNGKIMKKYLSLLLMLIGCMSANAQQGYYVRRGFVELTLDDSFIYRYVQALDAESQKAIDEDLLAGEKETGDGSIIKSREGQWYVKKDYQLPEGNYYESQFYKKENGDIIIIRPRLSVSLTKDYQVDNLMEHLGNKATLESYKNDIGAIVEYYLDCHMKTSDEVLGIIDSINDFCCDDMRWAIPDRFWLYQDYDSYLIKRLTGQEPANENGLRLIAEIDWTTWDHYYGWDWDYVVAVKGVGLIIDCTPYGDANYWEPQVAMIGNIPELKKGGRYLVKFTIEAPADGEIRLDLCSWDGSGATMAQIINVEGGEEEEYVIDFPDYPTTCTDGMIFYQCGHLPGQHIIKKVQVFKIVEANGRNNEGTAIDATKAVKADGAIYNFAGQKVDNSYKGIVIKNGKKYINNLDK